MFRPLGHLQVDSKIVGGKYHRQHFMLHINNNYMFRPLGHFQVDSKNEISSVPNIYVYHLLHYLDCIQQETVLELCRCHIFHSVPI
jgi:hypothetical protein